MTDKPIASSEARGLEEETDKSIASSEARDKEEREWSTNCLERSERLRRETGQQIASSKAGGWEEEAIPQIGSS